MSAARSLFLTGRVLLLAVVLGQTAAAGPPASLQISQAVAVGREIGVYLEVRDEAGAAVTGVTAGQLHATVGGHPATVSSLTPFAAAPTGVLYLFLVDRSRSLSAPRFARIRQALTDWVGALGAGDRAALIGFGDGVRVLVAPTADTADTAALLAAIAELAPTDGHTALHQALARAIDLGRRRAADLPERRVIVTLTDGVDDAPGGISAEEVYAILAEGPVPIYAVGFSSLRDRARREAGLEALGPLRPPLRRGLRRWRSGRPERGFRGHADAHRGGLSGPGPVCGLSAGRQSLPAPGRPARRRGHADRGYRPAPDARGSSYRAASDRARHGSAGPERVGSA